jgi:DEAD/DEAH box helicase domain-containing protein
VTVTPDAPAALGALDDIVDALATDDRLVHLHRLPPRPARVGTLARPLPRPVADRLPVTDLWSHQAAAIDLARDGRSVAVATGTASGKSLCFQLPIAEVVTQPVRPGTALALFPTKALAHDQLRSLTDLSVPGLVAAAYDGDCDEHERAWARRNANVVLTNPEMLHYGLLPHHVRWDRFLSRLRYVVLDELHVFRGIFGTHVAHVLRRLRRLCAHYGADPVFVFTSATIGAPAVLASALCGLPVTAITEDGSPRGERVLALWNPPLLDGPKGWDTGLRRSSHREVATLVAELVDHGHRTLAFCASRRATELVAGDVRRMLPAERADRVQPYRAGYLAAERREIETALFTGQLDAVVATNALELGIDVAGVDACVLDGYPGTVASLWQQAGRAGRERQPSVAVLVAGQDQLDQWVMTHPAEVLARAPEPAVINPANPYVLHAHLMCAAFELPLSHGDAAYWPDLLDDGVRDLVRDDRLAIRRHRAGRRDRGPGAPVAVLSERGFPAHGVGLRSGSSTEYRIVKRDGTLVGTVDESRAFDAVHPGAVYLHHGDTYRVERLHQRGREAIVVPFAGNELTAARHDTSVRLLQIDAIQPVGRAWVGLGSVEVVTHVTGYQRTNASTGELLGTESLDLPPARLRTRGFWYTFGSRVLSVADLSRPTWPGTLHAVEHASIGILPLFTICDRWDVGGVSTVLQADTGLPTIVVYDGYPGGAGIAELGYSVAERHLAATLDVVESCGCATGCPSCVQSPKCGNGNDPLDKAGAAALLRAVLLRRC